ncbi:MAG: glutamine amidotransferase [Janthinobacterium lividum]
MSQWLETLRNDSHSLIPTNVIPSKVDQPMFPLLFKYPIPVFTRGHLVFLSGWPAWLLAVSIVFVAAGLAVLIQFRLRQLTAAVRGEASRLGKRRSWAIWAVQSALLALLLFLVWQPAISVAELSSQQNIIAVVVDNSRSMATPDSDGKPRETAALTALQSGVLDGLNKRFRTRLYTLNGGLTKVDSLHAIQPVATATHIGDGLQKLAEETSDLPVGAVVLLTDGSENSAGVGSGASIGLPAMQALRNRRLPVHTVAFGSDKVEHDIEMEDVSVSPNVVANSRIAATVSFTQHGYTNTRASITVRDGDKAIAVHEITLGPNGAIQTEPLFFSAGSAGAKTLRFTVEPLPGEANGKNNALTRPVMVSDTKRRILYVEGEPRWQFRFLRRAEEDDPSVQIVSMLRTSENKIYRQGIDHPEELADGFPVKAEDLFQYSGIIIGSVDASYFSPLQQELLREYVDRRGGGLLFLGGRASLSDGAWGASSLNDLLPTTLPSGRANFHRNPATVSLTQSGVESPVTRLLEDPQKNAERWRKLAYLSDYEDPGTPRPGATVLAEMNGNRKRMPLLITENYGNGRTAILASGGTWRWQMSEPLGDPSHNLFWQQLLRWLVADTPGAVSASASAHTLSDQGKLQLSAQVRDKQFHAATDAHVSAHIIGPAGVSAVLDMTPSQETPGLYQAAYTADKPGSYLAEISADSAGIKSETLGDDVLTFQREDGVQEDFHVEANRVLLDQLAKETGGRAWSGSNLKDLPRDISYSEAGISVRSTKELWNLPIVFLLLLGLPISEWLLRRKWGVV